MKPCLCAGTRRAARLLTALYENEMKPSGLHPAQFELLNRIAAIPTATQSTLAENISADQTTLSRNLKCLVRDGMLVSEPGEKDRRQTYYRLTEKGREALKVATVGWTRAQKRMERALGPDWMKAQAILSRLTEAAKHEA